MTEQKRPEQDTLLERIKQELAPENDHPTRRSNNPYSLLAEAAALIAAAPTLGQYAALLAAHAETLGRWIPVSERLPEDELDILVVFKTGDVYPVTVTWLDGKIHLTMYTSDTHRGYFDQRHITHWRPLPAPPAQAASAEGGAE